MQMLTHRNIVLVKYPQFTAHITEGDTTAAYSELLFHQPCWTQKKHLHSPHTTPSHNCDELPLQQEAVQVPTPGTFISKVSPSLNKTFFLPLCCPPPLPPSLQKAKIFIECHKQGIISNTPKGTVGLSLWHICPVRVKKQHPGYGNRLLTKRNKNTDYTNLHLNLVIHCHKETKTLITQTST